MCSFQEYFVQLNDSTEYNDNNNWFRIPETRSIDEHIANIPLGLYGSMQKHAKQMVFLKTSTLYNPEIDIFLVSWCRDELVAFRVENKSSVMWNGVPARFNFSNNIWANFPLWNFWFKICRFKNSPIPDATTNYDV